MGSFYKHPLKKGKSGYSSIIGQPVNPQAVENGEKIRARGCFGFEVEEFTYSYKLKTLTILQLSDVFYNVCVCVWSKIWMRACGGTDGMGGETLTAASISVNV